MEKHLKDSYFVDGGNATKAWIIDHLFQSRAPYLLIDEIDKMSPRDQTFLLNLMETGIITETKYEKTREAEIKTSVFATCNDPRKLSSPLQSRFFIVELEPYTYEEFYEITVNLLDKDFARIIADAVLPTIQVYPYLTKLKEIIKKYKNESRNYPFDALVSIQTKDTGASLQYIDDSGVSTDPDEYIIIGSNTSRIISSAFLRSIWYRDITMERFIKDVFFIIKFIDRFQLDNTVGLGGNFPQIFLIPDRDNMVQEIHPYSLRGYE